MYGEGQTIWLVPAHVRFDFNHQWVRPCPITGQDRTDFNNVVRDYAYYNCVAELGTYAKYYIKEREWIIRSVKEPPLYWVTDFGWGSYESDNLFSKISPTKPTDPIHEGTWQEATEADAEFKEKANE